MTAHRDLKTRRRHWLIENATVWALVLLGYEQGIATFAFLVGVYVMIQIAMGVIVLVAQGGLNIAPPVPLWLDALTVSIPITALLELRYDASIMASAYAIGVGLLVLCYLLPMRTGARFQA